MSSQVEFVDIDWDGRRVSIEYQWLGTADATRVHGREHRRNRFQFGERIAQRR